MTLYSAVDNGDGTIKLSGGQPILNTHSSGDCYGEFCPLHNPSDHDLRDAPLYFNSVNMLRKLSDDSFVVDPDDYFYNQGLTVVIRNSAKCLSCNGPEIVSIHRHDFQECDCGNVFVDGGANYIRHGFKNAEEYENTSITVKK